MGLTEITPSMPVSGTGFGGEGDSARTTQENRVRDAMDMMARHILLMESNDTHTQYLFISKSLMCFRAEGCLNLDP